MKIKLFFIALMLWVNGSNASTIETTSKGSIGRKNAGCKGLGICLSSNGIEGEIAFSFRKNNVDGKFEITFSEKEITEKQPAAIEYLKGKVVFTFEEDIALLPNIVSILGLRSGVILRGVYPLQLINGRYVISINE